MRVLVTGGSGWLARAIVRFWPENEYVLYSRDESSQARAQERLRDVLGVRRWVLGDIRDEDRLECAMRGCEVVIHTAGMKRVDDCEANVWEAVSVNVDGSRTVARLADKLGVRVALAISTDKAVEPISVYGQTKALMEKLWIERDQASGSTHFTIFRCANFVGSTGSVVEVWKRQLAESGRITLTDPDMTRFWVGAKETVGLIQRLVMCPPQSGYADMGGARSMSVGVLAALLAGDAIFITGPRSGERLHEYMSLGSPDSSHGPFLTTDAMLSLIAEGERV